jgi:hypothetical protein
MVGVAFDSGDVLRPFRSGFASASCVTFPMLDALKACFQGASTFERFVAIAFKASLTLAAISPDWRIRNRLANGI